MGYKQLNMFSYSRWLSTPLQTRIKIAGEFGIEKKGSVEVFNNEIKADGYYIKDVEKALSLESLQNYLDSTNDDLDNLWELLINKIEGREIKEPREASDKPKKIVRNLPGARVRKHN